MGHKHTSDWSWHLGVLLLALTLAAACKGQTAQSDSAASNTQPLQTETSTPGAPESVPPAPPPPPEGAYLAQLPPEQTSQLTNLGVDVVAPGAVPPTFSVVDIRTVQPDAEAPGLDMGASYMVVYQDPTNRCFAVEFAADGMGTPPATENRIPIQSPLFNDQDYGLNYGPFQDEAIRVQFPGSNLYSDWLIGPAGAYRLIGSTYISDFFPALKGCQDIAPEAAVSIVESFTVLTPQAMGDGFP